VLRVDGFGSAALADQLFLILQISEQFNDVAGIFLKICGIAIDGGFQGRRGHAGASL
jgi:hypothetical protein